MVDVKASGQTRWLFNAMPHQALGVWILRFNNQDQIVRAGNNCSSSIRVASVDENKNSHRKITMTHTQTTCPNRIALHTGKKSSASCWCWSSDLTVRKISYRAQTKTKITKMQTHNTNRDIQRSNVECLYLNRIGQLPKLTASAIDHNIDIICIQEHGYSHIKYHDTGR